MNKFYQSVVENNRKIFQDVNAEDIIKDLRQDQILSEDDCIKITAETSKRKTDTLLEILMRKTEPWFENFLSALNKEYYWIKDALEKGANIKDKMDYTLGSIGNVPPLPQHHVKREQLLRDIRGRIQSLNKIKKLVVKGMSGMGKSSLVAEALRDPYLLTGLNWSVFWLTVGTSSSEEEEKSQCQTLLIQLCEMARIEPTAVNLDIQLKQHFGQSSLKDSLLVLDDVSSVYIIKALDIGIKTVIITKDMESFINSDISYEIFELSEGFTADESITLLSRCVMVSKSDKLMDENIEKSMRNIHRLCTGMPMIISLIAGELAEHKEEARCKIDRWKDCELELASMPADLHNGRRESLVLRALSSTINLFVEKLDEEMRILYSKLVVFVPDANITIGALETLWGKSSREVNDIMTILCRRSLSVRRYSPALNSYVYGVHDLLLGYLKQQQNEKELHIDFLLKYREKCNGDFSNLVNDNYIFSYICHHVDVAGEWDEYRQQFLDLQYIGAKLAATGPGDLLVDLVKYREPLANGNEKLNREIEEILKFVKKYGWSIHHKNEHTIQCALLESKKSSLYQKADSLIKGGKFSGEYFLEWKHTESSSRSHEMNDSYNAADVQSLSLVSNDSPANSSRFLVNQKENTVEVDMSYKKARRYLRHPERSGGKVNLICQSPAMTYLASCHENGDVVIWNWLQQQQHTSDTPPASMRQFAWTNVLNWDVDQTDRRKAILKGTDKIVSVSFSEDEKHFLTSSQSGKMKMYDTADQCKCLWEFKTHPSPYAETCSIIEETAIYATGDLKIVFLRKVDGEKLFCQNVDESFLKIICLLPVRDEKRTMLVVTRRAIQKWCWQAPYRKDVQAVSSYGFNESQGFTLISLDLQQHSIKLNRDDIVIKCAAANSEFLAIGTQAHGCFLLQFNSSLDDTPLIPVDSESGTGCIQCINISSDRLIFSSNNKIELKWLNKITMNTSASSITYSVPLAHLGWTTENACVGGLVLKNGKEEVLQVHHHNEFLNNHSLPSLPETEPEVTCIQISKHGQQLLVGTKKGKVYHLLLIPSGDLAWRLQNFELPGEVKFLRFITSGPGIMYYVAATETSWDWNGPSVHVVCFVKDVRLVSARLEVPLVETFITSGGWLLGVCRDYSILAWNLEGTNESSSIKLLNGRKTATITGACLSSDGKLLVLSNKDNCFHIVSLPEDYSPFMKSSQSNNGSLESKMVRLKTYDDEVTKSLLCCGLSGDNRLIALGQEGGVLLWDVKGQEKVATLQMGDCRVTHLAFSPVNNGSGDENRKLILLAVSDSLTWWDVSNFISNIKLKTAKILRSIKLEFLPVQVSVSHDYTHFGWIDEKGFLSLLRKRSDRNSDDDQNGNIIN